MNSPTLCFPRFIENNLSNMSDSELMKLPGYSNPEFAEVRHNIHLYTCSFMKLTSVKALASGIKVSSLDETTDIPALRAMLLERKKALTASAGPSSSQIVETDHTISTRDGCEIVVRVYQGPKSHGGPVMVMLHGGGWVLGGLDNEALLCRMWVEEVDGVCVNVDYRLAPEVTFPVPVYDCYDAIKWTAENAQIHGGDLDKGFVVAGVSAGANMACSVCHLARDDQLQPRISGTYLSIPSLLAPEAVPDRWKPLYTSREENKDAPILNAGAIALFRSK
jgi:acetyl esterase/lipase